MKTVTLAQCRKMIDFLLGEAAKQNNRPLAIVIADPTGNPISMTLMDGYHSRGTQFASNKAYTCAKMGMRGADFHTLVENSGNSLTAFCDPRMTTMIGSAPLRDETGELIGAIAVSGWKSEEDQDLADAAAKLI